MRRLACSGRHSRYAPRESGVSYRSPESSTTASEKDWMRRVISARTSFFPSGRCTDLSGSSKFWMRPESTAISPNTTCADTWSFRQENKRNRTNMHRTTTLEARPTLMVVDCQPRFLRTATCQIAEAAAWAFRRNVARIVGQACESGEQIVFVEMDGYGSTVEDILQSAGNT
jgi:hypothetical protein